MLKNIPNIISPELFKIMMEMGHGDELTIADGNFPGSSHATNKIIRADGHNICEILKSILKFFPLDPYSNNQILLMKVLDNDNYVPTIWDDFKKIINEFEPKYNKIGYLDRFDFYTRAKKSHVIIQTSEKSLYANIILTKGII